MKNSESPWLVDKPIVEMPQFYNKFSRRLSQPIKYEKHERERILGLCEDKHGRRNTVFLPNKWLKLIDEEEYIYLKLELKMRKK